MAASAIRGKQNRRRLSQIAMNPTPVSFLPVQFGADIGRAPLILNRATTEISPTKKTSRFLSISSRSHTLT